MLRPGEVVSIEEANRIHDLGRSEKEREIDLLVVEGGLRIGEDHTEGLRAVLHQYYDAPFRYQRVPGIVGDLLHGVPLEFEAESRQ